MDRFELAFAELEKEDPFEKAFVELQERDLSPVARKEQRMVSELRQVPQAINRGEGLPVGGEPMVGGPDILALEPGQTKTFMEDEEGKPVEVRRAEAIGVTGKVIPEPISPDGMSLDSRGSLIKEKAKELQATSGLPFSEYMSKSSAIRDELKKLQEAQQ